MLDITERPHCDECEKCIYYWENCDNDMECGGDDEVCHEFIENKLN